MHRALRRGDGDFSYFVVATIGFELSSAGQRRSGQEECGYRQPQNLGSPSPVPEWRSWYRCLALSRPSLELVQTAVTQPFMSDVFVGASSRGRQARRRVRRKLPAETSTFRCCPRARIERCIHRRGASRAKRAQLGSSLALRQVPALSPQTQVRRDHRCPRAKGMSRDVEHRCSALQSPGGRALQSVQRC